MKTKKNKIYISHINQYKKKTRKLKNKKQKTENRKKNDFSSSMFYLW